MSSLEAGSRRYSARPVTSSKLRDLVESRGFGVGVTLVIVVNALSLGLETWPPAMERAGALLLAIDRIALWLFTVEIALKLWVYRAAYFRSAWNLFDFAIVSIAWIPASGPLAVLRTLRILRAIRLLSVVPQMRTVVGALFKALPGMGSIIAVLLLFFYVASVMATKLFATDFPDWFGSIGASMYSLFQIMTLESWSMGIVRPVMEQYPLAWAFFVPFIVVTSFTVLNLFIALIVNSMQSLHERDQQVVRHEAAVAHDERAALHQRIDLLTEELRQLRRGLDIDKR